MEILFFLSLHQHVISHFNLFWLIWIFNFMWSFVVAPVHKYIYCISCQLVHICVKTKKRFKKRSTVQSCTAIMWSSTTVHAVQETELWTLMCISNLFWQCFCVYIHLSNYLSRRVLYWGFKGWISLFNSHCSWLFITKMKRNDCRQQ